MDATTRHAAALIAPPPELHTCVRAFYWRHVGAVPAGPGGDGHTYIPPGPYPALVWMVDGRARLTELGGRAVSQELPRVMLGGPHRHAYRSEALTAYRSFGLVLQPAALALLSGLSLADWIDRIGPAHEALPPDWHPWLEAIGAAGSHRERAALACEFLAPRWAAVAPARTPWARLAEAAWQRPLQHLAMAAMNWSQRHFQRRTREVTGLRAVEVERLIRCERALIALRDGGGSVAEVAAAHGYADQAHFTREVRGFFGAPPGVLMRHLGGPPAEGDWLVRLPVRTFKDWPSQGD